MKKIFVFCAAIVAAMAVNAWDELFIVGGGTKEAGWDNERIPMVKISETEFEYSGYFFKTNIHGDISLNQGWKIVSSGDSEDWGCTQYRPVGDWAKCERGAEFTVSDNAEMNDNKVWVEEAGFYTINIKTDENKVTITNDTLPKRLYPVGEGCEVGWDTHSNIFLTETGADNGIYTGTLTLVNTNENHELKFLCQRVYTAHFGPKDASDGKRDIKGEGEYQSALYVTGDQKFWVLNEAVGEYDITLNAKEGKLTLVAHTPSAVENANVNANVNKVVRNGMLVIVKDGVEYNVCGQKL